MSSEKWKRELDALVNKIEQHSTASLWRIKRECDRSGLPVDKAFRKFFLRATNERIAQTFDRLEDQSSSNEPNKDRQTINRRSRSKSRPNRCSQGKSRLSRRSRSKSRSNRRSRSKFRAVKSSGRSPRKPVVHRSPISLSSVPLKPSTSQSTDYSRENCVRSSSRKREANRSSSSRKREVDRSNPSTKRETDRSSSRKTNETKSHSTGLNGSTRVGKVIITEAAAKLQPDSMIFGCVHCANTKDSTEFCSDDIELIYGHWLSAHTDLPKAKPFQFYVTELVACHFCDVIGTFPEVIKHQKTVHRKKSLSIGNQSNREKCALCNHVGKLDEHFERVHSYILSKGASNPFRVTDEILKKILNIDIHQKSQCGHCGTIYETFDELEHHNSLAHSKLAVISNQIVDEKRVDVHCGKCNLKVNQEEYFKHLEEHSFQFKCSECEFQTNILAELMAHNDRVHKSQVVKIRSEEFTGHLKDVHSKSKMIFSNGLVLLTFNLKGTKYDKSSKFAEVLRKLEEQVDGLVRKRSETVARDKTREFTREFTREIITNGKSSERGAENSIDNDESSEEDTDTDSDTFSMSSETSTSTSISLSSSISSLTSETKLSKSDLLAELRKQNELVNNLSITGIPCLRNENLFRIFDRICVKINAPVSQRDVLTIFRTSGPNQPIIVKMKTWTAKATIKRCFKHKDLWSSEIVSLPVHMPSSRIYVNLHTTRFYGRMVQIAKYYKTTGIIQSYYLCENGLLVRSRDGEKDFPILSKMELLNWIKNVKDRQFKRKIKREMRSPSRLDAPGHKNRRYD